MNSGNKGQETRVSALKSRDLRKKKRIEHEQSIIDGILSMQSITRDSKSTSATRDSNESARVRINGVVNLNVSANVSAFVSNTNDSIPCGFVSI